MEEFGMTAGGAQDRSVDLDAAEGPQALRRSAERLRKIYEVGTIGIICFDASGTMVDANDAFLEMVGFTRADLNAGKLSWQKLTPPRWIDASLEELEKLRTTGALGPYEKEYVRSDGSPCWFLFAGVALDGGDALEVVVDISERKAAERELSTLTAALEARVQERTEEVRALATQLTLAEQQERNRVAQVLHDDLQQRLYALQLQFDFLREAHEGEDEEAFQRDAQSIESELHEIMRVTRRLSTDLSPPILYDDGLREAVAWLANQMQEQFGLTVTVVAYESFRVRDDGLRVLLFQAVRELLFNVVKHAGTSVATVRLERAGEHTRIIVRDEGRGFERDAVLAQAPQGRGLAALRHRLRLVMAEMKVETQPGAGTHVEIVVPLRL